MTSRPIAPRTAPSRTAPSRTAPTQRRPKRRLAALIWPIVALLAFCTLLMPTSAQAALPNANCANVSVSPDPDTLTARPGDTITLTYRNDPKPGCNRAMRLGVSASSRSTGVKKIVTEKVGDLVYKAHITLKEETWRTEWVVLNILHYYRVVTNQWTLWQSSSTGFIYIDVMDWEGNDFAITEISAESEPSYDGNRLRMSFDSDNLDPRNLTYEVDWSIAYEGPESGTKTGTCRLTRTDQTCSGYFDQDVATPGEYAVTACINTEGPNQVPDGDESNNCATENVTVLAPLPDLAADFVPNPPAATVGEETTAAVRVYSLSRAYTAPIDTEIELRTPSGETVRMPIFQLQGTQTIAVPWTPSSAGVGLLSVEVDPDHVIAEVNEFNNGSSQEVEVDEPIILLPDLYFQPHDLTFSPADPLPGDWITFTVRLQNRGSLEAPAGVRIRFEYEGHSESVVCADPIAAHGGYCEQGFPVLATAGLHTATATADPNNAIAEIFETNNQRSINYAVSDGGGGVTCQGTWQLTGVGHGFNTLGPGSVVDDCHVYWGQNQPTDPSVCWETSGADLWTAVWLDSDADGCPDYATATDGKATYEYQVTILP